MSARNFEQQHSRARSGGLDRRGCAGRAKSHDDDVGVEIPARNPIQRDRVGSRKSSSVSVKGEVTRMNDDFRGSLMQNSRYSTTRIDEFTRARGLRMTSRGSLTHQEDVDMSLRLEDIEKIRQLKYRYWRSIDTGDIAALEELFTEDVRVDYIGGSYRWQMQGRDKIIESIAQSFHAECGCVSHRTPPGDRGADRHDGHRDLVPDRRLHQPRREDPHDRQRALPGQIPSASAASGASRSQPTSGSDEEVEKFEKMPNLTAHYLKRVPPPVAKAG